MSRCFPFPPPGYEKEARSGDAGDLLKKEKRKEKKHKKEKREKEKSESKERKDKDKSRDKHKERKDRKEKHRDKTKDKDRDKAKSRTPEDTRNETRHEIRHDCEAEEVQDSKFAEELGRRIRDAERGAAGQSVGNFTATTRGRLEAVDVSTAVEKESGNKMAPNLIGTDQRRSENLSRPIEKRTGGMGTGFATAKQRVASGHAVLDFTSTERGKNHVKSQQVDNFTSPHQSRTEGTITANSLQEGRGGSNSITGQHVNNSMGSGQRRTEGMLASNPIHKEIHKERIGNINVSDQPVDNVIASVQRSTFAANSMQKERGANNNTAPNFVGTTQRKNNGIGMGQQAQNLSSPIQRSMEMERIKDGEIAVQKERGASNDTASNFLGAAQRKNGRMEQQVGNIMSSVQKNAEDVVIAPRMEKEAVRNSDTVPSTIGTEQKTDDRSSEKKKERKEKSKEKKIKEGKGEERKDRDRSEKKSKRKDKDRHKEKEKEEKIRDESDSKKHKLDAPEEIKKANQVDTITKHVAPPAEIPNTITADGSSKKRKETEINGFLHETDGRPNKLPRTSAFSSHSTVENGKALKLTSVTLDTVNKPKAEIVLDNKETKLNGKTEVRPSSVMSGPGESGKMSSKVSSRPPHPDAKYLSTVYSVPKHAELPEFDDQDWLFASKDSKPLMKLEDDAILPQVWARGLQIESADVFALPYVVPF